jgi:hypothetical protein
VSCADKIDRGNGLMPMSPDDVPRPVYTFNSSGAIVSSFEWTWSGGTCRGGDTDVSK